MIDFDEPVLGPELDKGSAEKAGSNDAAAGILRLVEDQPFCVLATQGESQPYTSLIAYAHTPDLKHLFFTTSVATRKYRLLSECNRAALLIDNRCRHPDGFMEVEALTVTGKAIQLQRSEEFNRAAERLSDRHPYIKPFIYADTTALFRFDVIRCLHVTRFQEVVQWIP